MVAAEPSKNGGDVKVEKDLIHKIVCQIEVSLVPDDRTYDDNVSFLICSTTFPMSIYGKTSS